MKFTESRIPGAWIIDVTPIHDDRGLFAMTWRPDEFITRGMDPSLAQCNLAFSRKKGTLRGMHFQVAPHAQAKVIRCTRGALLDVIVDLRPESPALEVLELLAHRGATVSYTDPYVAAFKHASLDLQHVDEAIAHQGADCGVIITDHKVFNYSAMVERFPLLVDTRNALKGVAGPQIFRL